MKTIVAVAVLILTFLPGSRIYAQDQNKVEIYGLVTDEQDKPLPFTAVYRKGTTQGTTANQNGRYSLKLPRGKHKLVFQHVGYRTIEKDVPLTGQAVNLDLQMEPAIVQLREVVVRAGAEDPAYRIIRNAIKMRKYYLKEVKSYKADVYIKGLQQLEKAPEKVLGFNVTIDTGIVYLSESVSKLSFQQPDKIDEKVISSKVSGDNRTFSYNQASQMMLSFYENLLFAEGLSERGFVSPIANNAMLFYNYELEGIIQEGDLLINKVKVIPKRRHDPVFSGHIYIIEDRWRIHSVDLFLTKENQIEFIDSLEVNQLYTPVENDIWMLFSQRFTFQWKIFGFEGSGYFVGVYSNYEIEPQFPKKHFDNEIVSVDKQANKRDSIYWKSIRPIPLTQVEKQDYHLKDSIQVIRESKPYKDSIDQINNELTVGNIFIGGYTYSNSFKKLSISTDPITSILQYNTVEGTVVNPKIAFRKTFEDRSFVELTPNFRYGFSNERFNALFNGRYYYNTKKFAFVRIRFGRFVAQYNEDEPISPLINTYGTLFEEKNYMKLFEKTFLNIRHRTEIINGLLVTAGIEYAERRQLQNTSDFTFFDRDEREFSPNIPENINLADASFAEHQAFTIDLSLRIRFAQKYYSRPYWKINLDSPYPTLTLNYKKGISGVLGSDITFDRVAVKIDDDLRFGLLGSGSFLLNAGTTFNKKSTTLIDFQHFNGNRTPFAKFEIGNFQLLDYYRYSTLGDFYTAHYEHHFNGFIFNKLPLLRKLKLQVVSGVNYLYTDGTRSYWEIGVGIEHIFKVGRVDFYSSYKDGEQLDNGFRMGIGF